MAALEHLGSGKVREIFRIDDDRLLIVASDRISAFDVVLGEEIPHKGQVLTGVSLHWFDILDTPHHLISADTATMDFLSPRQQQDFAGRSMLVQAAEVIPMECVIRGYLYGSSWSEYSQGGGPTTEHLPGGLEMASRLPEPIFTPATKAAQGTHDENISFEDVSNIVGEDTAKEIKRISIELYQNGRDLASRNGIIVADTKFEFGVVDDHLMLIDEVLTPDSSRFWPMDEYKPGGAQKSFDKQFLRDYLNSIDWPKEPPPPKLPPEVIQITRDKYLEVLERLTGKGL